MEKKPRARTSAKIRFAMQSRTAAAIAICTVILFVLINGTVAVNASKVSIPGDPVYPVKKLVESAQLAFTFSKDGDTELYIQMAKTRATEMQYLALEGRYELIPATAQAYIRNINRAIVLLDAVHADRSPRAEELNIQMMEVLSAHETLAVMLDMVPPDTRTEIATTLNTSAISSQIAQAIFGK